MKKNTPFICIMSMLLYGSLVMGQVQISDVKNLVQSDEYKKIFLSDGNRLLLVEVNKSETKISEVLENGLTFVRAIDHQQVDQNRVYESLQFPTRPNVILKGDTLFEVFSKGIVASSVTDGIQLAYDEPLGKSLNISAVEEIKEEPSFLVRYFQGQDTHYGKYNYAEKKMTNYPFLKGIRIGNKIYSLLPDSITSLDLLTGQIKTEIKSGLGELQIKSVGFSGNTVIWVDDGQGTQYCIDGKRGLRQLPCMLPPEFMRMYWTDSLLYYCVDKSFAIESFVIDVQNCDTISIQLVPNLGGYYILEVDKGERVCFSVWNEVENRNEGQIFDPGLNSWIPVSPDFTIYYQAPQIVLQGYTYSVKIRNQDFIGNIYEMFEIDAANYSSTSLDFDNFANYITNLEYHVHPETGFLYVWTQTQNGSSNLWVDKGRGANPQLLTSFLSSKNIGLSNVNSPFVYGERVFYQANNGVYVTDREGTQKLLDFVDCTPFVFNNGFLFAVIQKPGYLFSYIKINPTTLEVKIKSVGSGINIYKNVKVAGPILVIGNTSISYYFDTRNEMLNKITYAGKELFVSDMVVSKNNLVFYGQYLNNKELYLWDTEKNKILLIANMGNKYYQYLPDNDGGFYLLPGNSGAGNKIKKMDGNGNVTDVSTIGVGPGYIYNNAIGLDGPVQTFPFPGDNEIIFHSDRQGKININYIPFQNTIYNRWFFWKEVNETVVVETEVGGKKHTWIWKYDESPQDITPDGREESLLQAFIIGDSVLLQYHDVVTAKMQFILYNLQSRTFEVKKVIESSKNSLKGSEFEWQNDHAFLLSLFTPELGNELWKYDMMNNELTLVKDFVEGKVDGNPSNFTLTQDNIYFLSTALDGSRQWFAINGSTSISDLSEDDKLLSIYPNPASHQLTIGIDLEKLEFFDLRGSKRYAETRLVKGQYIDISPLETGLYTLMGLTSDGKLYHGKLSVVTSK